MDTHPQQVDVLVAGAGPAGLTLALALKRLGLAPLVIDRQAEGANTSRAAVVHARTLEVLDELGVTAGLLERGVKVPRFRVRDRDRCLLDIDFSELVTPYPYTLMIPQNETESLIMSRLRAEGGFVERPAELTALVRSGERIDAVLSSDGAERVVSASWVVGCDGAHSLVRSLAGIAFKGGGYDETFVLADVRMDWPLSRDEVNLFFSAQGLVVVAPLPDDRFRIVATVDKAPAIIDAQFVQAVIDARGTSAKARVTELVWTSSFHLQHRVSETPISGRILLCGDAAHVHSPAGGQGMNTGIQDAAALASPLREALASGRTDALRQWAERRHAVAEDVVSLTDRMTKVATLRSGALRGIRNAVLSAAGRFPAVTDRIAKRLAELDYR